MEEIYGEDNQLGTIIWDKRNPKGDAKGIAIQHEYIVIYAKNKKEYLQSNPLKRRKKNAQKILKTAEDIYNKYKEENKILQPIILFLLFIQLQEKNVQCLIEDGEIPQQR